MLEHVRYIFWIVTNLPYIQQLTFDSPTRVEKTFIKQIKSLGKKKKKLFSMNWH